MPTAMVLSQGDEVLTGQVVDTNAAWLSQRLTDAGVTLARHLVIGDHIEHLAAGFGEAIGRVDLVLCTGGLGPTADDLTAESLATVTGRPLHCDPAALAAIEAMYASFGRPMPAANRKQAMLPEGALRLPNPHGTAPGFLLEVANTVIACMPGVPHEMRSMYTEQVDPWMRARWSLTPGRLVVLRITGLGESAIQDRIAGLSAPGVTLSTRSSLLENHLKLRVAPDTPSSVVRDLVARLRRAIGPAVYGVDGLGEQPEGSLVERIAHHLLARRHTLAVAESCTGGQLMAACTAVPGSSGWFREGVCTYSNAAKRARLGVPANLLTTHGAVSEPVARAMAEGIRATAQADWGIGTTGIAGPGGGTPDKPVGTVHLAVAGPHGTAHRAVRLPGSRAQVQQRAVAAALTALHRALVPPNPLRSRP